jgi:energy-coupling factor transporter ATP-binding protein EcfA2
MNINQIKRPTLHLKHRLNPKNFQVIKNFEISPAVQASNGDLVLILGLPGSGKSNMASILAMIGYKHFEAGMFFEIGGIYRFDGTRIKDAHVWCRHMARQALARGDNVVVSNTFTTVWEMEPYFSMTTRKVRVIEAKGNLGNVHGAPPETVHRMALRWESMPKCMRSTTDPLLYERI